MRRITGNRTVYLLKIFVLIFIDLMEDMQGSNGINTGRRLSFYWFMHL